jgi:hypothetical protein
MKRGRMIWGPMPFVKELELIKVEERINKDAVAMDRFLEYAQMGKKHQRNCK